MLANKNTIVILTPDRHIDRRVILFADTLENSGFKVTIIAMPYEQDYLDDKRVVRAGSGVSANNQFNKTLFIYRWMRNNISISNKVIKYVKQFFWRHIFNQAEFYQKIFYNTADKYNADILIAVDLPMLPVAIKLSKKSNAILIYDSHELYSEQEFSNKEKKYWAEIEKINIASCDIVITVNQSIANEFSKRYNLKDVKVIQNCEPIRYKTKPYFKFHEKFKLSNNSKILLMQGSLSDGRNLINLAISMKYVIDQSVVLIFLGSGSLFEDLKRVVQVNNLENKVYFHEQVPQNELHEYTMSAHAGIIPYQPICLNNYYCTPNKLFEYISAGIPVISTDLPEIRNILVANNIGLVGDTSTSQRIGELINFFFSNHKMLLTWKKQLECVQKIINWECEEVKLIEIFNKYKKL